MSSLSCKPLFSFCLAALLFLPQSVFALLNIDGTRNQIFVFGSVTIGYDSNVFAEATERGDTVVTGSAGVELKRNAGAIAVHARATLQRLLFNEFTDQNAWNPNFFLEFNKTGGRTTGAFTISAYRSSRADSAVNLRTQSWNFPLGLSLKYPINDKFYVTSQTGYTRREYSEDARLLNHTDFSQAVDLFYVFTSKLDLFGSYRVRAGRTDLGSTTDHHVGIGATGGLLAKLNGTVRAGYGVREVNRTGESFGNLDVSASLQWNATRKFNATAVVARDFNTTATGLSVDSFSAALRGNYVFTRRFSVEGGVAVGRNRFLDAALVTRRDTFFSADAGATFVWNDHLRFSANYSFLRNWSTFGFSDFEQHGYTFSAHVRF